MNNEAPYPETELMQIIKAQPGDEFELNDLVNSAYRGESSKKGWTTEADLLDGQRSDPAGLEKDILDPNIQIFKVVLNNEITACVKLQRKDDYLFLSMLTSKPNLQNQGIGKTLLSFSEKYAIENQTFKIRMFVISIRSELISWYLSKGYRPTGETEAFPYDDERFGIPKRSDLEFIVLEKKLQGWIQQRLSIGGLGTFFFYLKIQSQRITP